jgi:hypothetical protein
LLPAAPAFSFFLFANKAVAVLPGAQFARLSFLAGSLTPATKAKLFGQPDRR